MSESALSEPARPGTVRPRDVGTAAIGLLTVSLLAFGIGLDWPEAVLIGLTAVALLGLRRLPSTNADEDWPMRPDAPDDRGVRREVTRLSWSLQGYEDRVERPSLRRLRAVAAPRLRARGLDLDRPEDAEACRALLGPEAYAVVTAGDRRIDVGFDAFRRALSVVEKLRAP